MTNIESDAVSKSIQEFYEDIGWEEHGDQTEDAVRWEDSRPVAAQYVSSCRRRVQEYIPEQGEKILDAASGPVQYPEYIDYSKGYRERYCVDLSARALEKARERLGDHAVGIQGNIVELDLPDEFFDCTISLHTIYHIAADQQEKAVRNLLRMTRAGRPVIIVYSNPNSLLGRVSRLLGRGKPPSSDDIYFHPHPLEWWSRFEDTATVSIMPWRFLAAQDSKSLVPNNALGRALFMWLFKWEERHPAAAARWGRYPIVILKKTT